MTWLTTFLKAVEELPALWAIAILANFAAVGWLARKVFGVIEEYAKRGPDGDFSRRMAEFNEMRDNVKQVVAELDLEKQRREAAERQHIIVVTSILRLVATIEAEADHINDELEPIRQELMRALEPPDIRPPEEVP